MNINDEWMELVNLLDSFKMNNIYYVTDNIIDALNYVETQLFDKNASFSHYLQYMERKEPIIENIHSYIK